MTSPRIDDSGSGNSVPQDVAANYQSGYSPNRSPGHFTLRGSPALAANLRHPSGVGLLLDSLCAVWQNAEEQNILVEVCTSSVSYWGSRQGVVDILFETRRSAAITEKSHTRGCLLPPQKILRLPVCWGVTQQASYAVVLRAYVRQSQAWPRRRLFVGVT